jgi:hypothetical protein
MYNKSLILSFMAISMACAAPAHAGESYAEVRGGYVWQDRFNSASIGTAGGHNWQIGANQFVGVEGSVDKATSRGGEYVWAVSGRLGTKVAANGRVYVTGGFSHAEAGGATHLGAGYQRALIGSIYLKGEYRHMFNDRGDMVLTGIGFAF